MLVAWLVVKEIQHVAAVQAVSDSENHFDRLLGVGNVLSSSGTNLNIQQWRVGLDDMKH